MQKITLLDKSQHIYQFAVTVHGSVIFHPSTNLLHTLTAHIAGVSITQARKQLLHIQGIAGVYIQPVHQKELYAVLQDIANELRRMKHERQKHQTRSE